MIGSVFARQARTLTVRSARTRNFSRKIVEEQKAFQGGSTPYLQEKLIPPTCAWDPRTLQWPSSAWEPL